MGLNADAILAHDFGEQRQSYAPRDAILYALGLGLPVDPLNADELRFLDETRLAVLPTFAVTLVSPGMWIRDPAFGVDFSRLVHLAQDADFDAPLPPEADVVGTARVQTLTDRGEGRGAELVVEREISDAGTGLLYCRLRQTLLLRGDGGFGGPPAPRLPDETPDRAPDAQFQVTISPRAALIYRLSGDWNPLHIDPGFARAAGFERPIMQGLGVYGAVGAALCTALGADPATLAKLACRFAGIVMPGDTIQVSAWADGQDGRFKAAVAGRNVLDQGRFQFGPAS